MNDFGPDVTLNNTILLKLPNLMDSLNEINPLENIENSELNIFSLIRFYYTLKIVSPESLEKNKVGNHILNLKVNDM